MVYQREEVIKQIEDQLFLINTIKIGRSIRFEELMAFPRLLKKIPLILASEKFVIKAEGTLISTLVCFLSEHFYLIFVDANM